MAELAVKYLDFADHYAEYGISDDSDIPRTTLVIRPLVVDQNWLVFSDDTGKLSSISSPDKTEVELSGWGDIGEIDLLIENLKKEGIKIPDLHNLKSFLLDYPELIDILPSICKLTREKFSLNKAQLFLELDRDIEGQDEQLVLFVRQDHYDDNILEIIDEIRSEYSDSLVGKKAWFIVMTDYAPPR
jgi:hypothetical protein